MSIIGIYFVVKGSKDVNGMKMVMKWVVWMLIVYGVLFGFMF